MVMHYSDPKNVADLIGENLEFVGADTTFKEAFGIDRRLAPDLIFKAEKNGRVIG